MKIRKEQKKKEQKKKTKRGCRKRREVDRVNRV
jgi:hypothetical protein